VFLLCCNIIESAQVGHVPVSKPRTEAFRLSLSRKVVELVEEKVVVALHMNHQHLSGDSKGRIPVFSEHPLGWEALRYPLIVGHLLSKILILNTSPFLCTVCKNN